MFNASMVQRMSYTLATAAIATGLNKSTILRAIKSGRISGKKDEFGEWCVESAELHRVYPAVVELSAGSDAPRRHGASTAAALEAEIESIIKRASDRLQQQLAELRDHRDAGRDQLQDSQRQPIDEQGRRRQEWWPESRRVTNVDREEPRPQQAAIPE
jgi:hypothetical protein